RAVSPPGPAPPDRSQTEEDPVTTPRSLRVSFGMAVLGLILQAPARGQDPPAKPEDKSPPPPVQLTDQDDHKRIMDLLNSTATGPVPVMMEFGFNFGPRGPGAGAAGKAAPKAGETAKAQLPAKGATPKAGGPFGPGGPGGGPSWQQQVLAKGWGYAILFPNSIQ